MIENVERAANDDTWPLRGSRPFAYSLLPGRLFAVLLLDPGSNMSTPGDREELKAEHVGNEQLIIRGGAPRAGQFV